MSTPDDLIQGWIDALVDRSRDHLRGELQALVRTLSEAAASDHAEAARAARVEAEAAAAALAAGALAAERAAADERQAAASEAARVEQQQALEALRAEHDQSRAAAVDAVEERAERDLALAVVSWRATERLAEMAAAAALADGVRALDQACTLSDILDALAAALAAQAPRSAVLVRREAQLRGWKWSGFDGDATAFSLLVDDECLVATALRTGTPQSASGPSPSAGILAPRADGRAAIALPLHVDGRVVAVVYADDDGEAARTVPSAWPEIVEILARHAARCFESITARRLPELLRASARERVRLQTLQQDDESAQRYARLLVAEIKLYHEGPLDEARRHGDILRRLRPQIERAQQLYAERVPEGIRVRTDYFGQELVRTLAAGDAALLGQAT